MAETYNPIEIARSIQRFGYFPSEPVVVMPDGGDFTVLEGNRRVTALQLLANPRKAKGLDDEAEWTELSKKAALPDRIPAVVVPNRIAVAPVIGYRHISGIQPWDPLAKAKFISEFIDDHKLTFEEVAALVGEAVGDVRSHYRNFAALRQAREQFRVDTTRAENAFTVFENAMRTSEVQRFTGAPAARDVDARKPPLPASRKSEFRELLTLMFGDSKNEPVISDSRQITKFAKVLDSKDGLETLRKTRNLEIAENTAAGRRTRLLKSLERAHGNLSAAVLDIGKFSKDPDVLALLEACDERVTEMLNRNK